ncbi:hypothetical protein FRUB_08526 [Fimbriiglobus ruber]|uniref:Uncharacterized protein n=1 Tax=Fimbriiglobus ruber TaxID=1908690 RepID=A0A225D4U1_9BACT|nr:hypothetical protein FRUB_08526 [Fimbriiglobus ruber]
MFGAVLLAGTAAFLLSFSTTATADERLKDVACRSVHLAYPGPEGTAFYNEATVDTSADGTYFCACGFNHGYYGIQQLGNGKKLAIFSIWDPTRGDDPKQVPEEKRVKQLYKDDAVRVGRFGGEGTGGQSFFDFDWKPGQTYRFLVTAEPDGKDRTAYTGYFYLSDKNEWKKLVTFSTLADGKPLGGYYSFVEDFKRNKVSATQTRRAEFGNGWVRTTKGDWVPLNQARFTADSNPVLNIDAGPLTDAHRFFLTTGGPIENKTTKLRNLMKVEPVTKLPADLPVK